MFDNKSQRRRFITTTSAVMLSGLAGCTGGDGGGSGGGSPTTTSQQPSVESFTNEAGVEVGSNWDGIRELAEEEGVPTLYTASDPEHVLQVLLPAYNEADGYPAIDDMEVITGGSGDLQARWITEYKSDNVQADFIATSSLPEILELGHLMEVNTEMLPELAGIPSQYVPDHGMKAPSLVQIGALMYNTNMVSNGRENNVIGDYWDLVEDDQWFGENIGIDPSPSEPKFIGIIETISGEDFMDVKDTVGREWLSALKSQRPMWVDSHSGLARQCAAGQFPVCFTYADNIGDNPEFPLSLFDVPHFVESSGHWFNNKAENPNKALAYVNWLMSDSGQELLSEIDTTIKAGQKNFPEGQYNIEDWVAVPSSGPKLSAFEELWNDVMGELSNY